MGQLVTISQLRSAERGQKKGAKLLDVGTFLFLLSRHSSKSRQEGECKRKGGGYHSEGKPAIQEFIRLKEVVSEREREAASKGKADSV